MSWEDIEKKTSPEVQAQAKKDKENKEQEVRDLTNAYKRLFQTDDGKRILGDLTQKFIYNNDVLLDATNINYQTAYKNGEGGVAKYIIHQLSREV